MALITVASSTGCVEALVQFFKKFPLIPNIAFIVITHFDAKHVAIVSQAVQSRTSYQVTLIKDNIQLQTQKIYFLPSHQNLAIRQGILKLVKSQPLHPQPPIDFFFESFAQEYKENAITVLLSGTGGDGIIGIQAIKNAGGLIFIQDPLEAKFNELLTQAIHTGLVDYVLPVNKIPGKIIKLLNYQLTEDSKQIPTELQQILILIHFHTRHDFSAYKIKTIFRRIEKRMDLHQLSTLKEYLEFLHHYPKEIDALYKSLLIGVTEFFRDPEAFNVLKKTLIARLIEINSIDYCIRIWVPGCSTGEEVYSIAMIVDECLELINRPYPVKIYGTDVDSSALLIAREGAYQHSLVAKISPARLDKYFVKHEDTYTIKNELRKNIVFGIQNVIKDAPFTKLDLICCRNLFIYLDANLQNKILAIFNYGLKEKGILLLGQSEAIDPASGFFTSLSQEIRIYEKKSGVTYEHSLLPLASFPENKTFPTISSIKKSQPTKKPEKLTLTKYIPISFIISKNGQIYYIQSQLELQLDSFKKKYHDNLLEIIPREIKNKLKDAIEIANQDKKKILYKNFSFKEKRSIYRIDIKIVPIEDIGPKKDLLLLIFENTISSKLINNVKSQYNSTFKLCRKIIELERELLYTKKNLQTTIAELQASNEALQSTNEELQSTNEEIETSKEEFQTVNEGLLQANTDLQNKMDQLIAIQDDIIHMFNRTEIAALFLDKNCCIKLFTAAVQKIIPLIDFDHGRHIQNINHRLIYENLYTDIYEVLENLVEKITQARDKSGRWYLIRIIPYQNLMQVIDGIIVTFTDITLCKESVKL